MTKPKRARKGQVPKVDEPAFFAACWKLGITAKDGFVPREIVIGLASVTELPDKKRKEKK